MRERAREAGGVALEDVVQRAPGEVVLVEREDSGSTLVCSAHAVRVAAWAAGLGRFVAVRAG